MMQIPDVETMFDLIKRKPRDLDEHMPLMRTYAEMCESVAELTARRESTISFLAGRPKSLVSYTTEVDNNVIRSTDLVADTTKWERRPLKNGRHRHRYA